VVKPPESQSLLPLRPGRGAGSEPDWELFRRLRSRPAPLPGREEMTAWIRWLAPPANIHGPFRAKGGKLLGPKNVGKDKALCYRAAPHAQIGAFKTRSLPMFAIELNGSNFDCFDAGNPKQFC